MLPANDEAFEEKLGVVSFRAVLKDAPEDDVESARGGAFCAPNDKDGVAVGTLVVDVLRPPNKPLELGVENKGVEPIEPVPSELGPAVDARVDIEEPR